MSQSRHEREFWIFHTKNPHVYRMLASLALELRRTGIRQWGIKSLYETCRYEIQIQTRSSATTFRLNNNFTAYYARLLMKSIPELRGFFKTRRHRGDHHYEI